MEKSLVATISNRIAMTWPENSADIAKELTYKIPRYPPTAPPLTVRNFSYLGRRLMYIPVGAANLIPEGYEIRDHRVLKPVEFPEFKGTLRPDQQEIYEKVNDNCVINANVSFGKTYTSLAIAKKLGQKTLVIVHNINLRIQWVEEIKKVYGIEPGIMGSGVKDTNSIIVVANIQTLRTCYEEYLEEFGTIIVDECHLCPASIFKKVAVAFKARYRIGLTATMQRKDGLGVMLKDIFSPTTFVPLEANKLEPKITVLKSQFKMPQSGRSYAERMNFLAESPEYFDIVSLAVDLQIRKGHTVLCLGNRKSLLMKLHEKFKYSELILGSGGYQHDRGEKIERIKNGESNVLFGYYRIFAEGFSVSELSSLVLAFPISAVDKRGNSLTDGGILEQVIGRILRPLEGKLQPEVIDIVLKDYTSSSQFKSRLAYYANKRYKLVYHEI